MNLQRIAAARAGRKWLFLPTHLSTRSTVQPSSFSLAHVPAYSSRVDEVYLAGPWELRRRPNPHAGERALQVFRLQLRPVGVQVSHFIGDHLVPLPLRHVNILH